MQMEDLSVVDVHNSLSGDVRGAGEGMDLLGEEVGEDNDSVVPMGSRQLCDKSIPTASQEPSRTSIGWVRARGC